MGREKRVNSIKFMLNMSIIVNKSNIKFKKDGFNNKKNKLGLIK